MSQTRLAFAIDIGSSSVRVLAYNANGQPIHELRAHYPYAAVTTPDGGAEFDATQLLDQILKCIDEVHTLLSDQPVIAVGTDTFVTNLLGLDAQGEPITPIYMWNDTRSREYVAALGLDPDDSYQRTGTKLHVSYWPSRLRWIEATQPDVFQKATHWLSIGEWLHLKLFGVARVSTSVAAWTGMLNRYTTQWDVETLQAAHVDPARLSEVNDKPFDKLIEPFASRWPKLKDAVWYPALSDGYTANVGCGCATPNHAAITIGTSGAMRVLLTGMPAQVPPGLFCYRVNHEQSLVGGALSNAGNVFAWLQKTLHIDHDPFDLACQPDDHGLTVLPYWAGERSIGWHIDASAAILGMTLNTTPADIARASLEAVIYGLVRIDRALTHWLEQPPTLIAAGGVLSASPAWAQVAADALGREVAISAEPESSARGVALLALGLQGKPLIQAVFTPRPAFTERYHAAMLRQQRAYDLLVGTHL